MKNITLKAHHLLMDSDYIGMIGRFLSEVNHQSPGIPDLDYNLPGNIEMLRHWINFSNFEETLEGAAPELATNFDYRFILHEWPDTDEHEDMYIVSMVINVMYHDPNKGGEHPVAVFSFDQTKATMLVPGLHFSNIAECCMFDPETLKASPYIAEFALLALSAFPIHESNQKLRALRYNFVETLKELIANIYQDMDMLTEDEETEDMEQPRTLN